MLRSQGVVLLRFLTPFLILEDIAKVLKLKITIKLAAQQTFLIAMLD